MTTQVHAATSAASINDFPAVIENRLTFMNIPFTYITYDAVNHVFIFDNSTNNGTLVIGGSLLATLGFETALPFYNMSAAKATSCTLTSQKIVDLSGNNSFYFSTSLGFGNYSCAGI